MTEEEKQHRLDVFAEVYGRYRSCRMLLDHKIGCINPAASAKQETRRESGKEKNLRFCADFLICARNAIGTRKNIRFEFFKMSFCDQLDTRFVCSRLQIAEGTAKRWRHELKLDVAAEFERLGIYPVQDYFDTPNTVLAERPAEVQA